MRWITLWLVLLVSTAFGADETDITLEKIQINIHDQAAIDRGAKFFAANCFACHGMKQLRYDDPSIRAGITYDTMPQLSPEAWGGHPPPDLSLETSIRGKNWVYSYLLAYYKTEKGYDNLVLPRTSMPNPFISLQGEQVLAIPLASVHKNSPRLYQALRLEKEGSIKSHEFNQHVVDLMHYLVYASDPSKLERDRLGPYVIAFILIFTLFAFLLYREYWKDIE